MKEIETRDDIAFLVESFYEKVRKNKVIGPFFNQTIHDWDSHLKTLTDFWETNLLFVPKYSGNPINPHIKMDQDFNNSIMQDHFDIWLELWGETLDKKFSGEKKEMAKMRARNMANMIFMRIYQARNPLDT